MLRKIHLDFHTAPETQGIGQDFDAELFADTLAAAQVNYLATPGKCHFGHVYYAAKVAIPHPHLADPDLFPRTVAACLKRGIRTQAYWTLGLDATRAKLNPAWRQTFADGSFANWGHYLHICFASPYVEQVVIPELLECLERCPGLVGFWFDISLYVDGAFYSADFNRLARERLGERAVDAQARWELARQIIRERCVQIDTAIKTVMPTAENFFNTLVNPGESGNLGLVALNEIENPILFGGPEKMSAYIRWLRGQGVPSIGLVSRFQGPWSDPGTLRSAQQMRFDVARTVALGAHISMGDHRYPDGHLEPEVYRRLAPVYAEVEAMEKLLESARPLTEALLVGALDAATGHGSLAPQLTPLAQQAVRVLEELGVQFDLATTADPWPATDCIIYLGEQPTTPEILARLQAHVAKGGALLAMNHAIDGAEALCPAAVVPWQAPQEEAVGNMGNIGHVGTVGAAAGAAGPSGDFIRLSPALGGEDFAYLLTLPARILQADGDADVLAWRHRPVSARPPFAAPEPDSPLIVQKGMVIYCSANLFGEAAAVGSPQPGTIIQALCRRLLGKPLVEHDAGPTVAAHLYEAEDRYILHLVHWAFDRWERGRNSAATFPLLAPITLQLQLRGRIERAIGLPNGEELAYFQSDGICRLTMPSFRIWQVAVLFKETSS